MNSIQEAVDYMGKSVDVQDWNQRRTVVFSKFVGEPLSVINRLILAIDGVDTETQQQSLIVKTLGKDDSVSNNTDNKS